MSEIVYAAAGRTWLLSTPNSSYVLRLDDTDTPCHLHWGVALSLEQAQALPWVHLREEESSFEGRPGHAEELSVDGGARYGVPALQVRFADGARALEWAYVDHEIRVGEDGALLRIRFGDRHYPLAIILQYLVHHDSDVIERQVTLVHQGDRDPISVLRADSATWALPPREDYRLSHVVGAWAAETQLRRGPLAHGETVLTSRRGITGHHANPWVMLDAGDATEDHGEVWSAALAWSGTWRITVQRPSNGAAGMTGGFGHDGVGWQLSPGQSLETPVFAGLYTGGGFGAASRAWHAYALAHVLPHPEEVRPVLYNSWEATGFDVDELGQRELAARAAALGVELFVMDDGWFGARRHERAGLGDWQASPERFPQGLGPLVKEVHRLGMGFGLWVEPEMVNPDSDLYRRHPDWVLHLPHRTRSQLRHQLVLNFARPEIAEWAYRWLDRLVAEHEIDFLKWDMNRAFSEAGWPEGESGGNGGGNAAVDGERLWIDHVRNVYSVIDRLRTAHPRLRIEACSGGGGRVDLGILSRTDQVWPSDNTDAQDRLTIQHGFSQVYPARTMASWVTDSPNPLTGSAIPLRYRCHVAMSGVMALGGNLLEWSAEDLEQAGAAVAFYKQIRGTVQHGAQYRLRPPGGGLDGGPSGGMSRGPSAVQYLSQDGKEAVIFAWQREYRFGQRPWPLRLAGLDPAARYRERGTGRLHHGALLLTHGLPLDLPVGQYASSLTVLDRLPGTAATAGATAGAMAGAMAAIEKDV